MLQHTRITDKLKAVTAVTPVTVPSSGPAKLTPSDFLEMDYDPVFLLPVPFEEALTTHVIYGDACETGFDSYFQEMYEWNKACDNTVFVGHIRTRQEVLKGVVEGMRDDDDECPLAWRVGFRLGWLSGLALTDVHLANVGMQLLIHLVNLKQCRSVEVRASSSECVHDVMAQVSMQHVGNQDFQEGWSKGSEVAEEEFESGEVLQSIDDVREFLQNEMSYQALEHEKEMGRILGVPCGVSFKKRIGFIVGYLTEMLSDEQ